MLAIVVDTGVSHRYSLQYEAFDTEALRMFPFQCYFIMRIGGGEKNQTKNKKKKKRFDRTEKGKMADYKS